MTTIPRSFRFMLNVFGPRYPGTKERKALAAYLHFVIGMRIVDIAKMLDESTSTIFSDVKCWVFEAGRSARFRKAVAFRVAAQWLYRDMTSANFAIRRDTRYSEGEN